MILLLYMPKHKGDSPKHKKHSKKQSSDDDSSSDYDPQKDEIEEMDTLEMQKFMQKIFPSKSGKERVKQLEKIDKLMDNSKNNGNKKSQPINKKIKKSKNEQIISEEDVSEEEYQDMSDEEYQDGDMSEGELEEFMKTNMKFNIIFSVPQGRGMYDDEWEEESTEEDGEGEEGSG